jgi:hypothetical protein
MLSGSDQKVRGQERLSHAQAEQPGRSAPFLRDAVACDLAIHLRPRGRLYPPKRRQAIIRRRLTKWEGDLRYDVLAVEIIGLRNFDRFAARPRR